MAIKVRENNLYINGRIIEFPNGEQLLLRDLLIIKGEQGDEFHTVVNGDRLDVLASRRYRKFVEDASKYWWVIADANSIQNPLDLSEFIGTQILIPNILNLRLKLRKPLTTK